MEMKRGTLVLKAWGWAFRFDMYTYIYIYIYERMAFAVPRAGALGLRFRTSS